uniref:Zinc finger PMZ-type domain-containing protein n=1 Tax=Nicotiana tabacum TaxID=4097 RepID=A0A1S3XL67_TOBAC|nr:PREDICTED: uncharacterized protein LOC107766328 [Nicotiana tabacum]
MRVDFMFNGDTGFELNNGPCKFIVDLRTGYCSYRSWELKDIPCLHVITTMHFKRLDPSENIRGRKESDNASTSKASTGGKSGGARSHYKRPRLQGHGVFVAQSGFTSINHGLPTARKVHIGPLIDSTHVTGDIGYKPPKGLKLKGKEVVTQRQLQVQVSMARIKTRSQSGGIQTRSKVIGKSSSKKTT